MRLRVSLILMVMVILFPVFKVYSRGDTRYEKLALLSKVLAHIEDSYIQEVDIDKLIYSAIKGMVSALDVHSEFLDPEEYRLIKEDTQGRFGGIGCEIRVEDGVPVVVSPLPDSPALKAGLKPGDIILKINGRSTKNKSPDQIVRMLRGKPSTKVKLLIKREGRENKIFEVDIEREIIKVIPVQGKLIGDDIGYIKIRIFQEDTVQRFKRIYNLLLKDSHGNLKGLILDLRGNPGGLFQQAVLLADLFLDRGVIVTTKGRNKRVLSVKRATKGSIKLPVVIVVNQYTASASEIFAGALQDHKRAKIVGTKTFGKGTVQSLIEFKDGSALKLTVAKYYTPSGRSIQADGIYPDIYIEDIPEEVLKKIHSKYIEVEKDLDRHLEEENKESEKESPCYNIKDIQLRIACDLLD